MRSRARHVSVALAALFGLPSLLVSQTATVTISPQDPVITVPTTCQTFSAVSLNSKGLPRRASFLWTVSSPAEFSADSTSGQVCLRGAAPAAGGSKTMVNAQVIGSTRNGTTSFTVMPAPAPVAVMAQPNAIISPQPGAIVQRALPQGAAPTGLYAGSGSPVSATISWSPATGATGYTVSRSTSPSGPFGPVTPSPITVTSHTDPNLTPSTTYYWVVTANYSNALAGSSPPVSASTLAPTNPADFAARPGGIGEIILSWSPRNDAASYWLQGDGLPAQQVNGTSFKAINLGPGPRNFSLIAYYTSGGQTFGDEANPSKTRGAALPKNGGPWLASPNGSGSKTEAVNYYSAIGALPNKDTFTKWKLVNGFPAQGPAPDEVRARYFNAQDLNLGRDTHCRPNNGRLACYQSNSGPVPGTADFPSAERALGDMVNGIPPFASVAMDQEANGNINFYAYNNSTDSIVTEAGLDTEGPKAMPNACTACHGGRYDPTSHTLSGASFLPFDVFGFKFASTTGFTLPDQQEAFRKLNLQVKNSAPNSTNSHNPIVTYIDGTYGNNVATPGATPSDNWVPAGWAAKPNVYDAFKRTCRTCHLAAREAVDFTSYSQLSTVRMSQLMCAFKVMPHAEVSYRKFWTQTTVYLPGYWSDPSVLGVTGCL
jgi:hypothetical protein